MDKKFLSIEVMNPPTEEEKKEILEMLTKAIQDEYYS